MKDVKSLAILYFFNLLWTWKFGALHYYYFVSNHNTVLNTYIPSTVLFLCQ